MAETEGSAASDKEGAVNFKSLMGVCKPNSQRRLIRGSECHRDIVYLAHSFFLTGMD